MGDDRVTAWLKNNEHSKREVLLRRNAIAGMKDGESEAEVIIAEARVCLGKDSVLYAAAEGGNAMDALTALGDKL